MTTAFVGLGNIGYPMAQSLIRAGHQLLAYDLDRNAVKRIEAEGGRAAESLGAVAAAADIVGICVVTDAQLRQVISGLLPGAVAGSLFVIHSTVLPATIEWASGVAQAKGVAVVDAPVSGGDIRAARGELAIMVGGDQNHVESLKHYLESLGTSHYVGPVGTGAAAKLAIQGMTFVNQLATLEVARFAALHGIDEPTLMSLAQETTGQSFATTNWGHFDRALFTHTLAGTEAMYRFWDKDLMNLCLAGREKGLSMPISAVGQQLIAPSFKERRTELEAKGVEFIA